MKELAIELNEDECFADEMLDKHEQPIYPFVRKSLGLMFEDQYIRKSTAAKKMRNNMDLAEYISEYLLWCYGIE